MHPRFVGNNSLRRRGTCSAGSPPPMSLAEAGRATMSGLTRCQLERACRFACPLVAALAVRSCEITPARRSTAGPRETALLGVPEHFPPRCAPNPQAAGGSWANRRRWATRPDRRRRGSCTPGMPVQPQDLPARRHIDPKPGRRYRRAVRQLRKQLVRREPLGGHGHWYPNGIANGRGILGQRRQTACARLGAPAGGGGSLLGTAVTAGAVVGAIRR